MSKRKNTIIIICFIIVILLGAGAAAYPLIASINNEHTQSLVQTDYEEKLQQLDTSEIDAALAAAREYNKQSLPCKLKMSIKSKPTCRHTKIF